MKSGDRVRVISAPEDEQELIGMEGDVVRVEEGYRVTVFLDDDKFPTVFLITELEVID